MPKPIVPIPELPDTFLALLAQVVAEVRTDRAHFPPLATPRQGIEAVQDELAELSNHDWNEPHPRNLPAMQQQALRVAALAIRFAHDVCNETTGRK